MSNPTCPPNWKGTVFLRHGDAGWTENYWVYNTTASGALNLLDTGFIPPRIALMNSNTQIIGIRISNPNVRGDSYFKFIGASAGTGTISGLPAPPEMGAIIRYNTNAGEKCIRFLHGLAADQWNADMSLNPTPHAWFTNLATLITWEQTNFRLWVKDLATSAYVIKTIDSTYVERIKEHRVGRPFGGYRGRSAKPAATP